MDKLLFKRILLGALTALILVYVIYLFFSANFNVLKTENATEMTVTDKIYSKGYIFRDEDYIVNDGNGYVSYEVEDGDEVSANGVVAKIYRESEDAVTGKKIESLDNQISELTALNNFYYSESVGLDVIDNEINKNMIAVMSDISKNKLSDSGESIHRLLSTINKRQMLTGKISDFSGKIAELENEKSSLQGSSNESIGEIKSPGAGYFVSLTDGYEKAFDCKNLSSLTVDKYDNVVPNDVPQNSIGKLVSGLNWYVACKVSPAEALNLSLFQNSNGVTLEMPFATSEKIPAKIVQINQENTDSDAVVIFQCNYMNSDLADSRQETVEIGIQDYTGLRVSKAALHDDYVEVDKTDENGNETTEEKKVQGVYVVHGRELLFKEVAIIYSEGDYVICDPEPEDGVLFSDDTLRLYDKVVVEGDNLYDGKIVN